MRLDLKNIIHVPGAELPFSFQLDLSDLDFYGAWPICEPVTVTGVVRNRAEMLELEATPLQQSASELRQLWQTL